MAILNSFLVLCVVLVGGGGGDACVCVLEGPQDMLCKLSHFIQSKYYFLALN